MIIELSVNTSEKNKINKNLSSLLSLEGTLKKETSIISPSIIVEVENPSGYNYMHIPEFGRYYFIIEIESFRTNLWRISGIADPLQSFASQILACEGLIDNAQMTSESYMSGNQWLSSVKSKTDIIAFPSGLNETGEYILITSGGVVS